MVSAPIVDLSTFTSGGSEDEKRRAGRMLCDSCHEYGYVNIVGHGMSEDLVARSFEWSKRLFELPHEEKMKAPHPPASSGVHRGYSAPGMEKVYSIEDREQQDEVGDDGDSLRKIKDFKESYEVGSEHYEYMPNVWLPEEVLPGYREFTTELYWHFNDLARHLLEAFSTGLGLGANERADFQALMSGHGNQLRLLHYPSVDSQKLRARLVERMPAHQDWSLFTLDFQDATGGLELQDLKRPGTFVAADPLPGSCVLNVGNMLERFSNGYLPSALHRVGLPATKERSNVTQERYSIIYFFAPDSTSVVAPLASCVTEERPSKYEPVEFGKYGEWLSKHMYE